MSVEIINGSRTSFGPRTVETQVPYAISTFGVRKQLVMPVDYSKLPTHVEGDVTGAAIPANALVTALYITPATTAFAGGTSYAINLVKDDGTVADVLEAAATLAEMNSGLADTPASFVGTDGPLYVEMVATGTFTAGEGSLVIEYIEQI